MSNALRTLALTAAMAGLVPVAAQAAVIVPCSALTCVTMNFTPTDFAAGDIKVFTPGITISNAKLFEANPGELDLVNLAFSGGKLPIVIDIDPKKFHVNALTLDYLSVFDITIKVTSTKDPKGKLLQPLAGGNGNRVDNWEVKTDAGDTSLLGSDDWITSIAFQADTSSGTGADFIGLNGLEFFQFQTSGGGGGGTVPEPAGYGLAALALLAAGAATRRRKSN